MPPEPGQKVCKPWATHKPYSCAPKLPSNGQQFMWMRAVNLWSRLKSSCHDRACETTLRDHTYSTQTLVLLTRMPMVCSASFASFVVNCKRQTWHLNSQPFWYLTLVTSPFYLYLPLCTSYRHPVVLIAHFAHCHYSNIITMSQNVTQCHMMWQYVHGYNIIIDSVNWEPALPVMR